MQLILDTDDDVQTDMSALENEKISNGNIEDIKCINLKEKQEEALADEENSIDDKENATDDKAMSPAQSDNEEILNYILNETSDVVNGDESKDTLNNDKPCEVNERVEDETENIFEAVEKEEHQVNNTHDEEEKIKSQDTENISDTLPISDSNKELDDTQININDNVNTDKTSDYDEMLGIQQELLDSQTCEDETKNTENGYSHNSNGDSEEACHKKVITDENKQNAIQDIVENDSVDKKIVTDESIEECKSEELSAVENVSEKPLDDGFKENENNDNSDEHSEEAIQEPVIEPESSKPNSVTIEDDDSINNDIKEILEDVIKNQKVLDETDSICAISGDISTTAPSDNENEVPEEIVKESEPNKSLEVVEVSEPNKNLEDPVLINDNSKDENLSVEEVIESTEKPTPLQNDSKEDIMDVDEVVENTEKITDVKTTESKVEEISSSDQSTEPIVVKDDMDVQEIVDDVKVTDKEPSSKQEVPQVKDSTVGNVPICKLSNTLDILSDDEDEPPKKEEPKVVTETKIDPKCIDLIDDDDIMVVEENKTEIEKPVEDKKEEKEVKPEIVDTETGEKTAKDSDDLFAKKDEKEIPESTVETKESPEIDISEKPKEEVISKPLLPKTFLKSAKRNLADMTREDLEEFCILKIVESIVDRSNLSEFKNKLKSMEQTMEETKKKAGMLAKQNRDLQVVLKSVQEEQKKRSLNAITPLKITRSVGMQVIMEKSNMRRKSVPNTPNRPVRNSAVTQSPQRQQKTPNNQYIPVPRLVPAGNPTTKSPQTPVQKVVPNGVKTSPSVKPGEKRQKMMSDTVDLTDDEPPAKVNRSNAPVRIVSPQQLMPPQRQPFGSVVNGPRKVFIPINGQNQGAIRPGQTIMLKSVPNPGNVRPRGTVPQITRLPSSAPRMNRVTAGRHPAPLPDSTKQYQPPNWKNLPPAPDLKLSKVENGIVISWKIDGYAEDSHEEIASYQLYAYQETSSPPSTSLWKKIGDVKALPLPMACTLTQFMAGFKYYFAVRAVDVRSRLGPFSLPGSILLLNKL